MKLICEVGSVEESPKRKIIAGRPLSMSRGMGLKAGEEVLNIGATVMKKRRDFFDGEGSCLIMVFGVEELGGNCDGCVTGAVVC